MCWPDGLRCAATPAARPDDSLDRRRAVAPVRRVCYATKMHPRTPEECDALFAQHVNAGDLDALVALYEPAATLVAAPGQTAVGHAAIRDALAGLIAAGVRITMHVIRVARAGDDLAVLYNDWSARGTGPDGAPVESTGKAFEVVRRQADGTWRFAIDDAYGRS